MKATTHYLELSVGAIEFTLERRPRRYKTMSIRIDREGAVLVRVPAKAGLGAVRNFVEKKTVWIERKRESALARLTRREFADGELIDFQGHRIPLLLEPAPVSRVSKAVFAHGGLTVRVPPALDGEERVEWIKRSLRLWFRPRANRHLQRLTAKLAQETGLEPRAVRIKNLRSSWGICRGRDISLNWRLIMAEPALAEYVIYHELCHLQHKGHNPVFWSALEAWLPDYKERRRELRELDPDWL